jgi:very-short-patch-repair endonuclease
MADPITLRRRARGMRNAPTLPEKRLWEVLRQGQVGGLRFRRQVPIGNYIADFACFAPKLIVEADSAWFHRDRAYDDARDRWFESQGFVVVRISSMEILERRERVAETILRRIGRA